MEQHRDAPDRDRVDDRGPREHVAGQHQAKVGAHVQLKCPPRAASRLPALAAARHNRRAAWHRDQLKHRFVGAAGQSCPNRGATSFDGGVPKPAIRALPTRPLRYAPETFDAITDFRWTWG